MQPVEQSRLPQLPGKLYYTISEVSTMCGVKPHVLRYWESEFPSLRPRKAQGGSRRYRQRDIEEVMTIKSLLHDQGYRIAGARKFLAQRPQQTASSAREVADHASDQLVIPFGQLARTAQLEQVRLEMTKVLALIRDLIPKNSRSARG